MNLGLVVWVKLFPLGRSQRNRVDGQLSEEVRVNSGVPQWSVLGPVLFLVYGNDISRNSECNVRLLADNCIIYRKITDSSDMDSLQTDLKRLGEWAVQNEMGINPDKRKAERTERCVGTIQSGVLGPYRAASWDHTRRCVGTIQSGVLGPYRAAFWDHT